jgi:hypothetical protein
LNRDGTVVSSSFYKVWTRQAAGAPYHQVLRT